MPQLSLYVDQETLDRATAAARAEGVSVSKLVTGILSQNLADNWSADFLATFGSVSDPSFMEPSELDFADDAPREW